MDYHLTFLEKEKNGVTRLIILQEGQCYPPPTNFEDNSIYNLWSVIFVIYIIPYFLYEVILHYKRKKQKKKNVRSAHPQIHPGPLVPKSDTLSTRPRCQLVRVLK